MNLILVMLIQIKAGKQASESKFQEIINQLCAYTSQKQLPKHMKIRLLAYYYYRFRNSYFREKSILSNLSGISNIIYYFIRFLIKIYN